ncbi:immunoglobulin I-set domain protein [Dictyocaulus viviparus]|uniref:Immunoglobulin I-set domain protein n=1 Tax=Dictyocaulus viviparus TaxID=29172 RepID=A0A0D8XW60_DICVI|nr:immunoglobulin I-set domain protein [Dictyocaulus viviparus]
MLQNRLVLMFIYFVNASRYYHTNDEQLHFSNSENNPQVVRHSFFMQQFRLGYKLKLFCEAEGNPVPDIRWYKDGVEVQFRPGVRIRNEIDMDSIASYLDIDPSGVLDAGEYECVARNSFGYDLQHIRAKISL